MRPPLSRRIPGPPFVRDVIIAAGITIALISILTEAALTAARDLHRRHL